MAHIILATARRVGTKQTKKVAIDLTRHIRNLENTKNYWKKDIARNPNASYSNCSSFFHDVLLGTVTKGFVEGAVVESIDAKKIETIYSSGSVSTNSKGFSFRFGYKNVGGNLEINISYEQLGMKTPDFKKLAELLKQQDEIEEQIAIA